MLSKSHIGWTNHLLVAEVLGRIFNRWTENIAFHISFFSYFYVLELCLLCHIPIEGTNANTVLHLCRLQHSQRWPSITPIWSCAGSNQGLPLVGFVRSVMGRCVICGGLGISDAYYCKECTQQEKDRDGCPKIVNLGSAKTDLFYERKKYGFKKRWWIQIPCPRPDYRFLKLAQSQIHYEWIILDSTAFEPCFFYTDS